MKFSCEKSWLIAAVTNAARAAAAKSTVPALEGLLIEATHEITITGYDMKTGIRASFPADVTEPGSVVFNARLFGDIVRKLPDEVVHISVSQTCAATIVCGMSRFSIMGSAAADYPDLPSIDRQSTLTLESGKLKSLIAETNFAVSDNEARPIHTGALFELENGILTVVAVDGFRLALRRERITASELENITFVVPGTALTEVERMLPDSDTAVKICIAQKHIVFYMEGIMVVSRRLEGEFLNYRASVPTTTRFSVEVEKRDLIASVERVSMVISDKFKSPVKCVFSEDLVQLSTSSTMGSANDACPVRGNAEGLTIGFNNRYLLDALKAAPATSVRLQLSTPIAPCVIVPTDGERNFLYMILPVRMRNNES
ncbi:MAG: DNA polymerase III subunit beta [bacterium]